MAHVWVVEWWDDESNKWFGNGTSVYYSREDAREDLKNIEADDVYNKFRIAKYEREE